MSETKYVLAKTSRCYYGGEGRRDQTFDNVIDACVFAVEEGNPVGFDVYVKKSYIRRSPDWDEMGGLNKPYDPVVKWLAVKEIEKNFYKIAKQALTFIKILL